MLFDFGKNKTVAKLAGTVPDNFHCFYEETDEGFKLRDDPIVTAAVASISGFTKTVERVRSEFDKQKALADAADLGALSEYGDTTEAILAAFEAKLDETSTSGKKGVDEAVKRGVERAKKDMATAHAAEVEGLTKVSDAMRSHLHKRMISDDSQREIAAAGGNVELLMPHISPSLKVVEIDGGFATRVVDPDGTVRFGGTGSEMTIGERVAELKANETFGRLFDSESPSGGGLPTNQPRNPATKKPADMSPTEKIAAGLNAQQQMTPSQSRNSAPR